MTDKKVTIEITKEACDQLRSFLMYDREGTGEGYSDFILLSIDIRRQYAALTAERDALISLINEAYEKLGGGHHPYASGVRDALGYVLRGKDEARRALNEPPNLNQPTTTGEQGQ